MHHYSLLLTFFLLSIACAAITDPDTLFSKINQDFHTQYRSFGKQMHQQLQSPIHSLYFANIVIADLFEDTIKMQTTQPQPCSMQQTMSTYTYNELKTVSHLPAAIYLFLLQSSQPSPNTTTTTTNHTLSIDYPSKFIDQHSLLIHSKLYHHLQSVYLPMIHSFQEIASNRTCIQSILQHLQSVIQNELILNSNWNIKRLETKFTIKLNRALRECSEAAAKDQIQWLDQVLQQFSNTCNISFATLRQQTTFIVKGGKMPRKQNLQFQFFKKLVNTNSKFDKFKLLYTENIKTDEEAIQIAMNSVQDSILSRAFFEKQNMLHKDILSEGATKHLKHYFKNRK